MGNICCCYKDNIDTFLIKIKIKKGDIEHERIPTPPCDNNSYVNTEALETIRDEERIYNPVPNEIFNISKTVSSDPTKASSRSNVTLGSRTLLARQMGVGASIIDTPRGSTSKIAQAQSKNNYTFEPNIQNFASEDASFTNKNEQHKENHLNFKNYPKGTTVSETNNVTIQFESDTSQNYVSPVLLEPKRASSLNNVTLDSRTRLVKQMDIGASIIDIKGSASNITEAQSPRNNYTFDPNIYNFASKDTSLNNKSEQHKENHLNFKNTSKHTTVSETNNVTIQSEIDKSGNYVSQENFTQDKNNFLTKNDNTKRIRSVKNDDVFKDIFNATKAISKQLFSISQIEYTANVQYLTKDISCLFNLLLCADDSALIKQGYIYELEILNEDSWEFIEIRKTFMNTSSQLNFKIHSIEKVHNPFLIIQYALKKIKYIMKGIPFKEELLFHGTFKQNVENICQKNFDWRLTGIARGYKFGQGVSFSPYSNFSAHYGDTTYHKVMIAAKVLVGNSCLGTYRTIVPPEGYDTTTNGKGSVYVKYDDNTFYPAYLIHYSGFHR